MSITGAKDGEPTRVGTSVADITAGLFATIGILSALYRARTHGRGTDRRCGHVRRSGGHIGERCRALWRDRRSAPPSGQPPSIDRPLRAVRHAGRPAHGCSGQRRGCGASSVRCWRAGTRRGPPLSTNPCAMPTTPSCVRSWPRSSGERSSVAWQALLESPACPSARSTRSPR